MAKQTRKHRPVVERWNSKLETMGARVTDFAEKTSEYKETSKAFSQLAAPCATALESLENLPSDFVCTTSALQQSWTEGDVVHVAEDVAPLYTVSPDTDMTVLEVHRIGGNAEGKGAKIFLKVQAGKAVLTFPASHVE